MIRRALFHLGWISVAALTGVTATGTTDIAGAALHLLLDMVAWLLFVGCLTLALARRSRRRLGSLIVVMAGTFCIAVYQVNQDAPALLVLVGAVVAFFVWLRVLEEIVTGPADRPGRWGRLLSWYGRTISSALALVGLRRVARGVDWISERLERGEVSSYIAGAVTALLLALIICQGLGLGATFVRSHVFDVAEKARVEVVTGLYRGSPAVRRISWGPA